ncbi:hypothetical protein SO694_00007153 [Aureococcus anophagefferens]|uniref:Uncharacterized protein n=1 Tax=Aureococcus anophagefferens TaxID=44056 RepID=A0ABR1GAV4_AURAN
MLPTVEAIAPQRALKHRGDGPATAAPPARRARALGVHVAQRARALSPDAGAARPGLRPAAFVAAPDESEPSSRNDDGDFSARAAAPRRAARRAAADGAKPAFSPISPKKAIRKGFPQSGASLQPALPDHPPPPFAWASPARAPRARLHAEPPRARPRRAPEGDGEG